MKNWLRTTANKILARLPSPLISTAMLIRNLIRQDFSTFVKVFSFVPPGHFYSPFPSIREIRRNEAKIFDDVSEELPGINLNTQKQLDLLNDFIKYYQELPFKDEPSAGLRFYYQNGSYGYSDSIFLYSMIRHVKPKRIIEVGSGFSSCVILDTNDVFFGGTIQTSFIEPFPELLLSLIKKEDKERVSLHQSNLQNIPLDSFKSLGENDILFVDSTHVSKINSDVNYLMFKILPSLESGVYVHFHDIFYPFEYPREWVYQGKAWNEAYLLRAFLQFNDSFEIIFFNTFLEHFYPDLFKKHMPLCLKNLGSSLWIRKM